MSPREKYLRVMDEIEIVQTRRDVEGHPGEFEYIYHFLGIKGGWVKKSKMDVPAPLLHAAEYDFQIVCGAVEHGGPIPVKRFVRDENEVKAF